MREYLTVFLVAAVITYLLGVVAREVALRTGAVAKVRDRDVHAVPIPYFGGVAMLGGLGAAFLVARQLPFLSLSEDPIFHDATIEAIARQRPRSIAELRRVPGVGPMKLDRYGEEIIGVVVSES